jgi:hypothetical protein
VLKIRPEWAGKRGTCPQCRNIVEFPAFRAPSARSATTQHLLKVVAAEDDPSIDDLQSERLALLLSQGTCTDYRMADKLLAGRSLSPRQWRRVLNAADARESMRLRLEAHLEHAETHASTGEEPLAVLAAADAATPNAWKILARLVYFQRHGTCEACKANPTGLACIYRTFDSFLDARKIPEDRASNWKSILHLHVGL